MLVAECILHGLAERHGEQLRGPERVKEFFRALRPQFSAVNIDVADILVDGDLMAARCVITGTHADSGKPVNFSGIAMIRAKDDKIVEAWNHFDFHVMRQQFA